ncbi:MAG TPA: M20 family metallopeptidase [Thermomicrobiaceae bacterium]|nr:M20 family metallopeptidase [Thermomicrobiaceae bacterium]
MQPAELEGTLDRAVAARAGQAVDLLGRLVGALSLPLAEGRRDRPETAVGIMATALEGLGTTVSVVPTGPESETLIARLGSGPVTGPVLVLDAHLDTVPPGDAAEWDGLDPLRAHFGAATYLGDDRVRIAVDGRTVERTIRRRMGRVWEARGGGTRRVAVGRGAFDNKGPAVAQWLTLAALADLYREGQLAGGQLLVIFSTDEERGEAGIRAAVEWLRDAGYLERPRAADGYLAGIDAIVLEGSYTYLPVVGHRGRALLGLRTRGRSAHAATPELGDNAVVAMARLLARMDAGWPAFAAELAGLFDDGLLEPATAALGTTIAGGGVERVDATPEGMVVARGGTNVVPDWCEATVDLRHPRGAGYPDDLPMLPEQIRAAVANWVGTLEPAARVELLGASPAAAVGRSAAEAMTDPLVAAVLRARCAVLGLPGYVETAPGGTNGTSLIHRAAIRTLVECGPGGGLSHQPYEFVDLDDLADGARLLGRVALPVLAGSAAG